MLVYIMFVMDGCPCSHDIKSAPATSRCRRTKSRPRCPPASAWTTVSILAHRADMTYGARNASSRRAVLAGQPVRGAARQRSEKPGRYGIAQSTQAWRKKCVNFSCIGSTKQYLASRIAIAIDYHSIQLCPYGQHHRFRKAPAKESKEVV